MQYPCGRHFSYFQNVPQNEIHLHQRYANGLAISHTVHLKLFPYIWYICLACHSHMSATFDVSLTNFVPDNFLYLHLRFVSLNTLLDPLTFPNSVKKKSALPKTEFCANLYWIFYFFTILNPLSIQFDNSAQRLTLLKWRSLRLCEA